MYGGYEGVFMCRSYEMFSFGVIRRSYEAGSETFSRKAYENCIPRSKIEVSCRGDMRRFYLELMGRSRKV